MTAHAIKLQNASKVNALLVFLLCFRHFGEVYNTFVYITTFL